MSNVLLHWRIERLLSDDPI